MICVSENKEVHSIPLYSCCTTGGVTETCAYDTDDFAFSCRKFEKLSWCLYSSAVCFVHQTIVLVIAKCYVVYPLTDIHLFRKSSTKVPPPSHVIYWCRHMHNFSKHPSGVLTQTIDSKITNFVITFTRILKLYRTASGVWISWPIICSTTYE